MSVSHQSIIMIGPGGLPLVVPDLFAVPVSVCFGWGCKKVNNFDPLFPFFLSTSTAATYIFTVPTCTTFYNYLEPCALNAEFRHFIPRFNKTSLLCRPHSKRG